MPAATLVELVDGIAEYLAANVPDVYHYARWEGGTAGFPAVLPMTPTIDTYQATFDRSSSRLRKVEVDLWILAGPMEPARIGAAQRTLAELVDWDGERSIYRALAADRTLGGLVSDFNPRRMERLGIEEMNLVNAWGASIPCTANLVQEA